MEHTERIAEQERTKPPEVLKGRAHCHTSGVDGHKRKRQTLEEKIVERGKQVPQEEWDLVPHDLIDRLDFYTSGADV